MSFMRPNIEELEAFANVAETESFTKAAERLRVSKSMISRRVAALEQRLGVQLVRRTTHTVNLTEHGTAFHERVRRALEDLDDAVDELGAEATALRGLVRVTAPTNFGVLHVLPAVTALIRQHPALEIDVDLSDRYVDIVSGGFDLAIRIGDLKDSTLISRKLSTIRRAVVCSPDYLKEHGLPTTPAELESHSCLAYTNMRSVDQWRFLVDGDWKTPRVSGRLKSNDGSALLTAAINGVGLAGLPTFITDQAVENGDLVRVLEEFPMPEIGLFALFPPSARLPGRVRKVIEYLATEFGKAEF